MVSMPLAETKEKQPGFQLPLPRESIKYVHLRKGAIISKNPEKHAGQRK